MNFISIGLLLSLTLMGCSRGGPSYYEALQTERLEQEQLHRFVQGSPKLKWLDMELKALSDPKDRARLVAKHKAAIDEYDAYISNLKRFRSRFAYAIRVRKEIGRREGRLDEPPDAEEIENARKWTFDRDKGFPEK